MDQQRSVLVARAMGLLEGFEVGSRDDQVALMAVLTVYRASRTRYPAAESREMGRLLEVAQRLYAVYLQERLSYMGAVVGGVRLYDQLLLGCVSQQDTQEAYGMAKQLSPWRCGLSVSKRVKGL